ncbi:MAG: hypothetical protein ACR2LT_01180 [Pyrinomonadaceae bacterium]
MSIFENLIEELKQEHLIEEGVTELNYNDAKSGAEVSLNDAPQAKPAAISEESEISELALAKEAVAQSAVNENDFYRRRAMEEVSSLKMVEHILSGVEREQIKIVPKQYDDIAVSKALHEFLQVSKNSNSPENAAAEFNLMQETESWYSALSYRDKNILPAQLRRFCETTRPFLSSQALAALARFYRNSPFSESVRSKFEMVITRLFSRETKNEEREMVFEYNEVIQHLAELYADWSSISLYASDDDSAISEIVRQFEDFITEADGTSRFDELVASDFFNRLRAFKEQTSENFYAPKVSAIVIECNIRVGNIYVELLNKERRGNNNAFLKNQYNHLLENTISEATGKTLKLASLLENKKTAAIENDDSPTVNLVSEDEKEELVKPPESVKKPSQTLINKLLQVNKWLLGATILTIILTFGIYTWTQINDPQASTEGVQTFQMDGYYFKNYLKSAKIVNENLIGFVSSDWSNISDEKKEEVLKNILTVGKDNGFKTVRLQSKEGKTVGYAAENNITTANTNQN